MHDPPGRKDMLVINNTLRTLRISLAFLAVNGFLIFETASVRSASILKTPLDNGMETLTDFTKFLQACITPVALISGVGLLLLTITNRIGRVVDRIRNLVRELDNPGVRNEEIKKNQIPILLKRARLLKNSIAWLLIGMIASCLIIPLLFVMNLSRLDLKIVGDLLFVLSILSMLISFLYFFKDVLLSLNALALEASEYK